MRMIWRVLKRTLPALLAAVLLVAAINAFGEPLRPGVKAALRPPARAVPPQDNLFYALPGFDSRPADDIVQAVQAGRVDGDVLVAANRELPDRYRSLRRFARFANDTSPRVAPSVVPPMAGASQARKVWLLSLAGMAAKGEIDTADDRNRKMLPWPL